MENKDRKIDGLAQRHVAQIVRRKMTQQVKPSKKVYDRRKEKSNY